MFCSNCGAQLPNKAGACTTCGRRVRRGAARTLVLAGVVLILLVAAGLAGYRYYRISQLHTRLETAMGTDAGYTETILKIESDASNITFAELFALCDK